MKNEYSNHIGCVLSKCVSSLCYMFKVCADQYRYTLSEPHSGHSTINPTPLNVLLQFLHANDRGLAFGTSRTSIRSTTLHIGITFALFYVDLLRLSF